MISPTYLYPSQCGADYVKTQQRAPPGSPLQPGDRGASLDGDADRLVYYYIDAGKCIAAWVAVTSQLENCYFN